MGNLKVSTRLSILIGFMAVLLLAMGILGLYGISSANDSLRTVYEDRTVALAQLRSVERRMLENQMIGYMAMMNPSPEATPKRVAAIEANIESITKTWAEYMATYLTPDEEKLAKQFAESRGRFVKEGVKPMVAALKANAQTQARNIMDTAVTPLFDPASKDMQALIELQVNVAKDENAAAVTRYKVIRSVSIASIVGGLLACAAFGLAIIRSRDYGYARLPVRHEGNGNRLLASRRRISVYLVRVAATTRCQLNVLSPRHGGGT